METIIKHHQNRIYLTHKLIILVEQEGIKATDEITSLLEQGADPNHLPKYEDCLICIVLYAWPVDARSEDVELLTSFGANVNLPESLGQPPLEMRMRSNYPLEIKNLLLSKEALPIVHSRDDFMDSGIASRFGTANPEKIVDAYYQFMIATGTRASEIVISPFADYLKQFSKQEGI